MNDLIIGSIFGAAIATLVWISIDRYFINSVSRHNRLSLEARQREVENDHTNKWEVRIQTTHEGIYVEPWPVNNAGTIGLYQHYYGLGDKFSHYTHTGVVDASCHKWEKWCAEKNTLVSPHLFF